MESVPQPELTLTNGTALLRLSGDLDAAGVLDVQPALELALGAEPQTLVLDFAGVTFLDTVGLAMLVRANRRMRNLDGTVTVTNAAPSVADVLTRTGLDTTIRVERVLTAA